MFYKSEEPFLKMFDQEALDDSSFDDWAETRFFKKDQIQECLAPEYPDVQWTVDKLRRQQILKDLTSAAQSIDSSNWNFGLIIQYEFERENPPEFETAKGKQERTMNATLLEDCITAKQFKKLTDMDCANPANAGESATIRFAQAVASNLILGATDSVTPLYRSYKS